jgi:hypothetical protein
MLLVNILKKMKLVDSKEDKHNAFDVIACFAGKWKKIVKYRSRGKVFVDVWKDQKTRPEGTIERHT